MNEIEELICAKIKESRKMKKITLSKLSKIIGVSYQQMQKYECGKNRISAEKLYRISKALGVSIDYFFSNEWL